MRPAWRALALLFSIGSGLALVGLAGGVLATRLLDAPGPLAGEVTLVLPRGEGVGEVGRRLADAGVVDDAWGFQAAAALLRVERRLQAGEYRFPAGETMRRVLGRIASGDTLVRRLVVPEGLAVHGVLALLAAAEGLEGPLPANVVEGALAPDTYHYRHGDRREALVQRMRSAQERLLGELWASRRPDLPFATPAEALVLASIVEKETALPEERRRVAAVFVNRLARGMRLQADPTVVYALSEGRGELDRPLTRVDLRTPSPHNTYVVDGLPPTPIANPGRAAIAAVLDPLRTDELYFVADGSGWHVFARTLAEHNANVAQIRRRAPAAGSQ